MLINSQVLSLLLSEVNIVILMFIPFEWLHSELSNICRSLLRVKQLHAFLLKTYLSEDPFYATKILRQYAVNSDINSAHHVFDKTSDRSVYLWNSMIRAFAQSQRFFSAISLFRTMLGADISPDGHTYACVIRACADNFDYGMLRRVHGGAVAAGLGLDPVCCSALVTAYSKLGLVHEARRVFNRITEPDIVLWNSLISGYGSSGLWDVGMQMFSAMKLVGKKPDGYTLAGLLVGIVDSGVLSIGQGLHCLSQKSGLDADSHVSSLLVSFYSRCKCMDYAYRVFCSILNPDLVTWSALIMGYSQAGVFEKVLYLFRKLNIEDRKADTVLVASVLASIARTANVGLGCEVHGYALRHGLELDVRVSSALIDMYSKCGCLQLGISVFRIMPERNVVSYNSIILAFGLHGYAYEAFKVFEKMLEKGLVPDEATFSSLLSACCHGGLVKDGREIFRRMEEEFNIRPRAEHYVYMVKLLGSSGELEEAYSLIRSLPEPVDKAILGALLSCCNSRGNSELAETVAQQLFANNPTDNVYRVMLSNIYAGDGRWDDVKMLRDKITGRMRKMPGLSWIESS
ncbi:structure-specific endonuclease subunit SLX1 [Vigna unguiculata]|uniref:Structure-specific endonuclease subunit SLX1 n=1 Tax=Vigna unguiculata TaxID=3917 RepID=A0A4D6NSE3_VIGUN|nr:structure-specific endonuclease subunit SLX1 [Vigna unguiculata]